MADDFAADVKGRGRGFVTSPRLYGLAEIAETLGQRPEIVRVWHARGKLPPPSQSLKMGPVWWGDAIEPWIAEVRAAGGRPPERPRGRSPNKEGKS